MIISAKFNSRCTTCGKEIKVGNRVKWQPGKKGVRCIHHTGAPTPVVDETPPETADFLPPDAVGAASEEVEF